MDESTERPEIWLPAAGYEGFYEVSDYGQVRSVRHMTAAGWRGGKLLKPFPDRDGYLRVNLSCHGKISQIPVHALVLWTFAGLPGPGQQARHGRGGKQDNRWPENLCWGTPLENSGDKYRDGTMACGEKQGNARLAVADILVIRSRRAAGELQQSLADEFGTSQAHVSRIVLRQSWAHV
jgi:hypothetical protein